MSMEAPRPWTARKAMSWPRVWARLQSSEPQAEHGQADLEDAAPAEAVRHGAGEHQEAGHDERIRVQDPLQAGEASVQIVLDGGQRHVDDGDVHADQQEADAADGEDEVGAKLLLLCRRGGDAHGGFSGHP